MSWCKAKILHSTRCAINDLSRTGWSSPRGVSIQCKCQCRSAASYWAFHPSTSLQTSLTFQTGAHLCSCGDSCCCTHRYKGHCCCKPSTMLRIGLTVSLCQCVALTWPSNSKHSLMKLNGTTRSCAKGTLFTNTGAAWKTTPSVANWCVIIPWWQTFNYYSKATLESASKFLGIRRANVFFLNSAT